MREATERAVREGTAGPEMLRTVLTLTLTRTLALALTLTLTLTLALTLALALTLTPEQAAEKLLNERIAKQGEREVRLPLGTGQGGGWGGR